mgnify:CR=1 FL=1
MMQEQRFLQGDDLCGYFRGGLVGQQTAKHEVAENKVKSEDALASWRPNDGIHFHPGGELVLMAEAFKVVVAPADFEGSGDIFRRTLSPWLELNHPGEIDRGDRQISFFHISVNSGCGYAQVVCFEGEC